MVDQSTFYILSRCTKPDLYEFDLTKGILNERAPRPALSRCSIAKYKKFLYIVAGERDETISDVGLLYDSVENKWSEFHCPTGRNYSNVYTINDELFLFGGYDRDMNLQKTCSRYDFSTEHWTILPEMVKCRGQPGVSVYENSIYIFGGFSAIDNCEVERFDPREGLWSRAGKISIFGTLCSAVVRDTVHLLNQYSRKYCKYDPRSLQCTPFKMFPRDGKQWLESMNGQLYLLHYDGVDVIDEESDSLTTILRQRFEKCPVIIAFS